MEEKNNKKYQDALRELDMFKEKTIEKEIAHYSREYKASEYYRKPTLKDVVGKEIADDYSCLYNAIDKRESNIEVLIERFEKKVMYYGKSWWDEDLACLRAGYKWETGIYVCFLNIAMSIMGYEPKPFNEYYEGKGVN